jgi:hypothetical protein
MKFFNSFVLTLFSFGNFLTFAQVKPSATWTVFNDPMGDKKFAYVSLSDEPGTIMGTTSIGILKCQYDYTNSNGVKEYDFIWTPSTTGYWTKGEDGYETITMKFKIGGNIVDLQKHLRDKYPTYSDYTLKVSKQYGKFNMCGYYNYKFDCMTTSKIEEEIIDLFKKATLVTVDYDGVRYYISAVGFTKALMQL